MPGIEDFNSKFEKIASNSSTKLLNEEMSLYNPNAQISPYSYNAGSKGNSFFKRYYAYGPETFERIGFSPFRNNEEAFNEGVSAPREFLRSVEYGFAPLFVRGFVSGPKSLGRMLKGDFGDDPEEAAAYAEASAIASSTRGGISGFAGNLLTNFGYTAGIMVEALAEEALTLGLSSEYTIFNTAKNLGRGIKYVGRAPKVGKGILATESVLQRTKQMSSVLKNLDNITEARNYWQALKVDKSIGNVARTAEKVGKTPGGKILDFFNPASNTTEAIIDIAKNSKNFQGFDKVTNAAFKTAGGLYRDVRNINMALSEARLEAGFARKDTFDSLYDEYRETHNGEDPPEELQDEMRETAKRASEGALLANSLLIFASNKVAFDNIMSPKKGINRILNKKIADVKQSVANRTVREFTKKTLKSGKEVLTPKLTTIKKGWKDWKGTVEAVKKLGPRQVAKNVIGYTKTNIMEGFQESMQDVIANTSKDYYTEAFYSEPVASYYYTEGFLNKKNEDDKSFWEHLGKGFQSQFSAQGLETFASGFAMGTLATPLNKALPFIQTQIGKYRNKAQYDAAKKKVAEYDERMAKSVNKTFADDPLNMFNSRLYNLGVQSKLADQIADPDTKAKQDAIEEATVKQISQMIELNATDIWLDHLKNIKGLTTEEYAEYAGISIEQAEGHSQKIDQIISRTNDIVKNYDEVKEMYPNPVDLSAYKKGSVEYQKAALFSKAWDEAVKNVIFYNDNYKTTLSRMSKVYTAMTSNKLIGKVDPLRVQPLFDENDLDGEIGRLKTEIQALEGSTDPTSKKILTGRKESLVALEEFRQNYEEFMGHFYKTAKSQEDNEVQFIESQLNDIEAKLKTKPGRVERIRLEREQKRLNTRLTQFEKNEERTRERQELKNKRARISEINNEIDQLTTRKNNLSTPEYYDELTKGTQYNELEFERIDRKIADLEKELESVNTEVESTMDFTNEKMLANLEGSFKKYLKTLADQSNETLLEGNIDEAFELLVDYYRLGREAQGTAEAINILNDPAGFEEHVENNFAWMSDLWENREGMIKKNIMEQTKRIQYNNLLNSLAAEGIYVDLEEFANWKNNGELPTEFYDATNKRIIPKGSILYNQAIQNFVRLDFLSNMEERTKSPEQKLAENLKMLNALEQEEIDSLKQYNIKKELGVIEDKEFTIDTVEKKLGIDQYLEATYTTPDGTNVNITFYKGTDEKIRYNNAEGSLVGNISTKLREGKIFAFREEPDPVEVKAIKDKYDQLRAEAAEGSIASTSSVILEGGEVSLDDLSPDTPIANMPQELREQLKAAFEDYRDDPNNEYLFPENLTEEEIEQKFVNFIKSEPQALDLINEYIKEQKLKAATTGGTAAAPLITLTTGKKISAEDATDKQIQSVLQQYNIEINAIENNKNKSINDEIRLKELKEKYSILEAYVKSRAVKGLTPEMQNALELIKQLQKEQERIEALPTGYKIGQKILRRVTNVIQKFLGEKYEYDKKNVLLAAYNLTIGEGQSVKDFIDVLKSSNLPGFNEKSYKAIEKFVNDYIENRKGLEDLEGLRDATVNFITEQATYQWGRDRGNVIDDLTKKYFSGEKVQPNLDEISQEAFDSLYGRNGIYKTIKDYIDTNDLIVVANGLIVYDEDANVAGEIDLLVVDRKGNFQIIDIKTGETAKWTGYNNPKNKNYAKQIENTYQQMVYARLLKNMFGIDAKINILPIETTSDITTGKILTAKRPTAPTLLEKDKIVFPLKPTQEMYDKLNAEIPETAPKFNGTVPSNNVNDTINDPNLDDVEGTDYENENPEGEEGGEPNNLKEFNAFKSKIEKADFDELQLLTVDLAMNSLKYSVEQITELNNLIEARKEALKVQDETEEGEIITYNVDDQVYSESDIFTSTNQKFLSANQTAVISKISGDRITVKPKGEKTTMEMSIEEFKKKFKPASTLFSGEETDGPVVDESEGVTQESTDTVSDLLDGQDAASRQKALEDQAIVENTRDNLLDDLDC